MTTEMDQKLLAIANENTGHRIGTTRHRRTRTAVWVNLDESGSAADFIEVSCVGLKSMLRDAYHAGQTGTRTVTGGGK